MRALLVVAMFTMLCGSVDAAPKRKRRGTFAAYIESTAPDDPPPPLAPKLTRLSIVLLVDRSSEPARDTMRFDVLYGLSREIRENDLVAVLAFDKTTDIVLKPVWGRYEFKKVAAAVRVAASNERSDLAVALDYTRSYMANAPGRKVIVLTTRPVKRDVRLDAALAALRAANIELLVIERGGQDEGRLRAIAEGAGGLYIDERSSSAVPTPLERELRALHER